MKRLKMKNNKVGFLLQGLTTLLLLYNTIVNGVNQEWLKVFLGIVGIGFAQLVFSQLRYYSALANK